MCLYNFVASGTNWLEDKDTMSMIPEEYHRRYWADKAVDATTFGILEAGAEGGVAGQFIENTLKYSLLTKEQAILSGFSPKKLNSRGEQLTG